jgi:hypothetical protein
MWTCWNQDYPHADDVPFQNRNFTLPHFIAGGCGVDGTIWKWSSYTPKITKISSLLGKSFSNRWCQTVNLLAKERGFSGRSTGHSASWSSFRGSLYSVARDMSSQPDGFYQKHANVHDMCVCILLSICRLISRSFYFAPTKVWGLLNLFWDERLKPYKCWRNWSWGLRMGALAFGYVNQPNPSMIRTEGQYASRFLLWYGAQLLNWQTRHQPACFTWILNINIQSLQCFDVFRCF